jgi:hypothetical protein
MRATPEDYALFGLEPGATQEALRAAWLELVKQWHPDRCDAADATAKLQAINAAWMRICDEPLPPPPAWATNPLGDFLNELQRRGR